MLRRMDDGLSRVISRRKSTSCIDTQVLQILGIHALTTSYIKAPEENGGDPSGWVTPSWTFEGCERFCDSINAPFPVTAPGPALLGPTEGGGKLAGALNKEVWDVCQQRPGRFGFFASLPYLNDTEGTVAEIRNISDAKKKANGVLVMTSYGDRLVGDVAFKPIWDELNKRSALNIGGFLPQPVIDYPLATTRAAMSLLVFGIMSECTRVEVILSHAGDAFPMLAQRGIGALADPVIGKHSKVNILQAVRADPRAASRFWYDIVLSTSAAQLKALLATAPATNIVYGSDHPYAPLLGIYGGLLQYARFMRSPEGQMIGPTQLHENAVRLLGNHAPERGFLTYSVNRDWELPEPEFGLENNEDARKAREELEGLSGTLNH
ncbi:2-amino-3-carboxymuconate-6-semialdehyde decarboxylase [Xylaria acuta]|nr:2-amino-3-carboxymuconate-6-semialdehyde decarboxylase [Xylaria acuta]